MAGETASARFWAKVDRSGGPDACWMWMAGTNPTGYGVFHPSKGCTVGAHRYALEESAGRKLRHEEFACHRCDVPACVNPDHLFVGSHSDNMRDMTAKGRAASGSRKSSAALTEWQVVAMRHEASMGKPLLEMAEKYGVAQSLVSGIIRGNRWRHVGGPITKRYKKEAV